MIHQARRIGFVLLAALLNGIPASASAQVSNFEDGTTQGWLINLLGLGTPPAGTIPTNVATGGPAGAGDNYLLLNSTGDPGAGGRLMVLNPVFWGGNYLARGITSIRFDARNFGQTALSLRLAIEDPMNAPPADLTVSSPIILGVGSGWQTLEFSLLPSNLTAFLGTSEAALSNATVLRIFHSPIVTDQPERIAASLGIDNVTAVVTPEPSTFLLLGAGGLGLLLARRRRSIH